MKGILRRHVLHALAGGLVASLLFEILKALFGLGIAAYILYNAWMIARGALDMLMDRELPDVERQRIMEIALAHSEVLDLHDLRTRTSGRQTFIQLHLEMDGRMALKDAHDVADAVEAELLRVFPGAEVIIHQDPHGIDERHAQFG